MGGENTPDGKDGTRAADFASYDKLPADMREVLQQAATSFNSQAAMTLARKGYEADTLLQKITYVTKAETREIYGPDHPGASIELWQPLKAKRLIRERNTHAFAALARSKAQRRTRSRGTALAAT